MESIEQMIKNLCPDGIKFVKLGEVGKFYGGLSGKSKNDFVDGNAKFITYMNVYSNPSLSVDVEDKVVIKEGERQNTIQYGDILFTGSSETPDECGMSSVLTTYVDEDLYLNSFCFGYRFDDLTDINPLFLKHFFRSASLRKAIAKTANGVTRFNVSKKLFAEIEIPLPPMEIQNRIVEVLDKMTTLTSELEAELEARKQQYEYYRNKLLTFNKIGGGIRIVRLGDVCEIGTGSHNTQDGLTEGQYPFYTRGIEILYLNSFDYDETAIITAGDGAGVGKVIHFVNGKYALHQRAYRIVADNKQILARFVYHYMRATFYNYIMRSSVSSSVTSVRKPMLNDYPIPLPSLEEQKRIVSILDRLDSFTNDLQIGLPAEIEARRQQYEYYRNKLLTFGRKTA